MRTSMRSSYSRKRYTHSDGTVVPERQAHLIVSGELIREA